MTEPTTEAGRALLRDLDRSREKLTISSYMSQLEAAQDALAFAWAFQIKPAIFAIEAEARTQGALHENLEQG